MLGNKIIDPSGAESGIGSEIRGMELLDIDTQIREEKVRKQVDAKISFPKGVFESLKEVEISGYEIHMGESAKCGAAQVGTGADGDADAGNFVVSNGKNVYGSYVHGLFDKGNVAACILKALGKSDSEKFSYEEFKESQYDILADTIRQSMDMDYVYSCLAEAKID